MVTKTNKTMIEAEILSIWPRVSERWVRVAQG